ncbi:hypothetical protein BHM03_00061496 [Ensete ventricosum]|nr:hypothetical protein BHM03_00061496 [Ensete ventricosum]
MSAVDFGCRWSISIVDGRLTEKSTVGGRLKKKKGKEERRSTSPLSSPARCSRALAARGLPARRCRPRATIVPVFHTDLYRPYWAVRISPLGYRYADRPLLGGNAKIDRRQSFEGEIGRW